MSIVKILPSIKNLSYHCVAKRCSPIMTAVSICEFSLSTENKSKALDEEASI